MEEIKKHWDTIYHSKKPDEVSWTQDIPQTSLDFLHGAKLDKTARIIDVGGGESKFVDFMLQEGYENITVLDISEQALRRTQERLGEKAKKVNWIVSDITAFQPAIRYDFWHDRATFHFLTEASQILLYLTVVKNAINENGYITIGTFSTNGPEKCSGLPIRQYSEATLTAALQGFEKVKCITEDHITPFHTTQNFLFCMFKAMPGTQEAEE